MPTLKDYTVKVARLKNIRKMTKTMKMVSANKLRKAQEAERSAGQFSVRLNSILARLVPTARSENHPFFMRRSRAGRVKVVVFTSDRGLCGGFNNNVNKHVRKWMAENAARCGHIELSTCGHRGYLFFRNRAEVAKHYEGVTVKPRFVDAERIGGDLQGAFLDGRCDEVYLAYNVFNNPLSQKPTVERLLPMDLDRIVKDAGVPVSDCIVEPDVEEFLALLLPRLLNLRVFFALLSNAAGEHGARMTAMDNASTNADKLIEQFTLLRNRLRQAKITTELVEIVAGAEALK